MSVHVCRMLLAPEPSYHLAETPLSLDTSFLLSVQGTNVAQDLVSDQVDADSPLPHWHRACPES